MAENAAEEVEQDVGEQADERERSTIKFPYADLDNALRVPRAVHHFGTSCTLPQLAAQLGGMKINAGGFRQMLSAAQIFGLVLLSKQTVQMTVLGQRATDADQDKAVRAEAFLAVPLYRAVFDRVKDAGGTLPPASGLEQEMIRLGVVAKIVDRARQTFQRSAQQAGFFAFGQDKLVMPAVGAVHSKPPEKAPEEKKRPGDGGGNGGGAGDDFDPVLMVLLKKMPLTTENWPLEKRAKWLRMVANALDMLYPDEDSGELTIAVKHPTDSAK